MKSSILLNATALILLIGYILCHGDTVTVKKSSPQIPKTNSFYQLLEAVATNFLSGFLDRSFFITAFMAIRYQRCIVLIAASSALSLIGVISVFLGLTINNYISATWIDIFSICLFLFFGMKMVYEGLAMPKSEEMKFEEIPRILNPTDEEGLLNQGDIKLEKKIEKQKNGYHFEVFWQIFFLIFASEIGDRSQISTIYLTTNFDKFTVLTAVLIGQNLLTLLAIFGGIMIAKKIPERNLTVIAGSTFIAFGVVACYLMLYERLFTKESFSNKHVK
jgi:putative Ca2+/H+ antiporter (TMEM165/GDT1 family)